jgi:hypothetical protein
MAEATVDAVVSVVPGGGRSLFLVDWMITDMVSLPRNAASLPRQSATSVLAKSGNIYQTSRRCRRHVAFG